MAPAIIGLYATLALLLAGCATGSAVEKPRDVTRETPRNITKEELLAGQPILGDAEIPQVSDAEILRLDDDMRAFLEEHVPRWASDSKKVDQLLRAIANEGSFGLDYDEQTFTASETFQARVGNCLSFTNMFIAMARELGVYARYQEVEIPPDWLFEDDAFVLNRHVNVRVNPGRDGDHVVDFNIDDFKSTYDRRVISDNRAMAHYHNNVGVEHMRAGKHAEAFAKFRHAIVENDPYFSPVWGNLGTLYARTGRDDYAEAAYQQALRVHPLDYVAMSNLARLYERQGNASEADRYRQRVAYHRSRNPYYRYQQARQAYAAEDYSTAIGHLKYAIRKKKNEDSFYALLGLTYLKSGNEAEGRRWLERAEAVAANENLKRTYSSKIDLLFSSQDR